MKIFKPTEHAFFMIQTMDRIPSPIMYIVRQQIDLYEHIPMIGRYSQTGVDRNIDIVPT